MILIELKKRDCAFSIVLSAVFSQKMGTPITRHGRHDAAYLLNGTDIRIQDVAEICGFDDACFKGLFRSWAGMSTWKYRGNGKRWPTILPYQLPYERVFLSV